MGCSDSKLVNGQEAHSAEKENSKAVRFLAQHDQVGESQPKMRETRCSDELNEGKGAPKSRGKDSEGKKAQSKEEKENILKVRKAKQLHNKPQIDKFISQILEGNRQTATPSSPAALPEVKVAPTLAAKKATRWNTEVENPSKDYPNNAKQSAKTVEVKPQVSTSPKAAERVKAKTFMLEYDSQQSNQTLRL